MARAVVRIWSVTRKTILRTRSRPLDPTRSGLKAAPTGPGNSVGRVGGDGNVPGMSLQVGKCALFQKATMSKPRFLKQGVMDAFICW